MRTVCRVNNLYMATAAKRVEGTGVGLTKDPDYGVRVKFPDGHVQSCAPNSLAKK